MKQVKAILISWVVTVPISAVIAVIAFVLLNPFFPMP
jgi:phosphate/sulfate permease